MVPTYFRTEGEYEIFFNNSRVIYTNTDTGNYIIIKMKENFIRFVFLKYTTKPMKRI